MPWRFSDAGPCARPARHGRRPRNLVWGFDCQGSILLTSQKARYSAVVREGQACAHPRPTHISFVRPRRRLSFAPTASCRGRRAQTMSRLAACRPPKARPLHRRARRHGGRVGSIDSSLLVSSVHEAQCGLDHGIEGSPHCGEKFAPATLYSVGLLDPNHDAHMRIDCEAPRRRAQSAQRHESHGFFGSPPPRTVIGDPRNERIGPKLDGMSWVRPLRLRA